MFQSNSEVLVPSKLVGRNIHVNLSNLLFTPERTPWTPWTSHCQQSGKCYTILVNPGTRDSVVNWHTHIALLAPIYKVWLSVKMSNITSAVNEDDIDNMKSTYIRRSQSENLQNEFKDFKKPISHSHRWI